MKKRNSWFWPVQISAWCIFGLINYLVQHSNPAIPSVVIYLNVVAVIFGGLLITSLYRYYLIRKNYRFKLQASKFILSLLGATLAQAVCWLILIWIIFLPIAGRYHINNIKLAFNIIPLTGLLFIWNLVYWSYHLLRHYHKSEIEKWKLEAEIQKAQFANLKSQINPHFMFNALNNIRALILENPELARQMVTKFSEIFRYALQHSENKEVAVFEEISIVKQYLELIKIHYERKLQFTIVADDNALKKPIPPMIMQLLVENAVKHGIDVIAQGGEISIVVKYCNDALLLSVKNTGTLKNKKNLDGNLGIGFNNISERLKLLYGNKAYIQIEEQSPFVIVTIRINYDKSIDY